MYCWVFSASHVGGRKRR